MRTAIPTVALLMVQADLATGAADPLHFDGGKSSVMVDAYPGMPGDG